MKLAAMCTSVSGEMPDYGKLSGRQLEDMQAGARVEVDERKENPMDFALWKAAKPGEPAWDSPWGQGRPGWHIECSAMNLQHLGEQIDIHGGGNDLIFPHHENEIAQTESLTGKPFARYWVHNGMLQLSGEKMSKSLGNLVTIQDFLAQHEADVLRMMVLNSSYRSPLTFNDEVVGQAEKPLTVCVLPCARPLLKKDRSRRPPYKPCKNKWMPLARAFSMPWMMTSTLPALWRNSSTWCERLIRPAMAVWMPYICNRLRMYCPNWLPCWACAWNARRLKEARLPPS